MPARREEPPSGPLRLHEARASAEAKLQKRIDFGRELRDAPVGNLDEAWARYQLWDTYNKTLLESLFADRRMSDIYTAQELSFGYLEATNAELVESFRGNVTTKVNRLEAILGQLELAQEPLAPSARQTEHAQPLVPSRDRRAVFIVHGRNEPARAALFTFLRAVGLHPLEWGEVVAATGNAVPYIGQILDAAFARAQAVVVLLTPDDEGRLREEFRNPSDGPHETELTPQARQNVIFEAGMAMGRSPDRTVLVELGTLRPFSDVGGRHVIRLTDSVARRQDLALRLRTAGCAVNIDGTDWHTAGDFA